MTFLQETPKDKSIVLIEQIKILLDLGLNSSTPVGSIYLYLLKDLINQLDREVLGEI